MNYLGCMSTETMALRVSEKINSRLKFLYRKNRFLDVPLRRLLCNALIQPHFDYACTAWYPNLSKKLKDKLQVTQNKCIRFCLKLQSREHISNEHFHKLNWLPINQRFQQCVTSTVFKFVQNKCPAYMNEVFRPAENMRINTKNSFRKLNHPFRKTITGQKGLSYIGPAIWNKIPEIIKKPEIWILSNIRWNTTIWMIYLIQIYEMWVDLIVLGYHNIFLSAKRVCLILDLLFGTEFQKLLRKPEIWILSNIRWSTTIWMIYLIQIYEMWVDLIVLGYHKEYFSLC